MKRFFYGLFHEKKNNKTGAGALSFFGKRGMALTLVLCMMLSLAACGSKEDEENGQQVSAYGIDGYVYVPEYASIQTEGFVQEPVLYGDALYYVLENWDEESGRSSMGLYRKNVSDDSEPEKLPVTFDGEDGSDGISLRQLKLDAEGNFCMLLNEYRMSESSAGSPMMGSSRQFYYLAKYSKEGEKIFFEDITDSLTGSDTQDSPYGYSVYLQGMALDGEGNFYLNAQDSLFLFDKDGRDSGKVELTNYVDGMGRGKDGKVYCAMYSEGGFALYEVDFAGKKLGNSYANFPSYGYGEIQPGIEKDFLVYDGTGLYEYDCAAQSARLLLNWLDSDVITDNLEYVTALEDGRIFLVERSSGETTEYAFLTKTAISEVAEKQVITIGAFQVQTDLQNLAVKFNKQNDTYRIAIKTYYDTMGGYSQDAYADAQNAMNADILSGNGPDIFADNTGLNLQNFVSKGLVEDLAPYLEKSDKLSREDFMEPVLEAATVGGVLTSIPTSFEIMSIAGRKSLLGEKTGWTLDEMIAFLDANPSVTPMAYSTKERMLTVCLMLNQSAFIDYGKGTCSFDSEAFKKVLEFANRFPLDYEYDGGSAEGKVAAGKTLLYEADFYDFGNITETPQVFAGDDFTYIGFPTLDGRPGNILQPVDGMYIMSSQSKNKEGAWAFIEFSLLDNMSGESWYSFGIPSNKTLFEERLKEEMDREPYKKDENGQVMLDENGEPVRNSYGSSTSGEDGFTVYRYVPLPEEIEEFRNLIDSTISYDSYDEQILNIIMEEATPFFQGQKSVDEVAGIIQSKVSIYISENL